MDNIAEARSEISPFYQFLLLLAYAIGGVLLFTVLSFAVIIPLYGTSVFTGMLSGETTQENLNALKILQLASSVGLFLVPPIALALTERKKIGSFYSFKMPSVPLLGIVFAIMFFSMPMMEWSAAINQKMSLPEFLKPLEEWMRLKEDEAMKMTYLFLSGKSILDYLFNLILIALIPGVAEELMFRGGIQRTFGRWVGNPHVAIWLSAFLFSAIHLQFYGFLPRFLLGAGFGYIYFWSGSLWYAMFGHFLNNAYAVTVAWYFQRHNLPLEDADKSMNIPAYGYILSTIITIILLIYFKKKNDGKALG